MSLILLEGADKVGKSTITALYEQMGYTSIHMSAPDKKFNDPRYVGPTYFDEMVEMYANLSGDVVFDRSIWGEQVWAKVYKRRPQLIEPDYNYLQDMENEHGVRRILLVDKNVEAHWARCVENNEPLTREQFDLAYNLYFDMAAKYDFEVLTLDELHRELTNEKFAPKSKEAPIELKVVKKPTPPPAEKKIEVVRPSFLTDNDPLAKLAEANAINVVLSSPILKKKGGVFDNIEKDIRDFLGNKLKKLMGAPSEDLSSEEVQILKIMVQRMKDKQGSK